jgi:hypothetical protein
MSFTSLSKLTLANCAASSSVTDSIDDYSPQGVTTCDLFALSKSEDSPFTLTLPPSPKFSDGFHGLLSPPPSAGIKREAKPVPLVFQSTSKSSNGLISPPPSAGLKRRSHIRRKERPQRISQTKRVPPPIVITKALEFHQALQPPTSFSNTSYARSPPPPPPPRDPRRPSSFSYRPPLSAPILLQQVGRDSTSPDSPKDPPSSAPVCLPQGSGYRTDLHPPPKVLPLVIPISSWKESREGTDFALPSSPMSPLLSATVYVQESPNQTEFSAHDSSSSPLSAPIYLRHESQDRADFPMLDTPIGPPLAPIYLRQWSPDRPNFKFEVPESPGSIYSTMSPEQSRSVQWDMPGSLKAEDSEGLKYFMRRSDPWFVPEDEGEGLARQNTEQIVELLRLRRRKAGLE